MNAIKFGVTGVVLQGLFLAFFILVSRSAIAVFGKPAIVGLAAIGMTFMLWQGVRKAKTLTSLLILPVLLSIGYVIAFHLTGVLGFSGLLRDWAFSVDYLFSNIRIIVIVFVIYVIDTLILYLCANFSRKRSH